MDVIDHSINGKEQVLKDRKTLENDTAVFEELRVQEQNSLDFCHNMILCMSVCAGSVLSTHCNLPLISNLISLNFSILAFLLLLCYSANLPSLVTTIFFSIMIIKIKAEHHKTWSLHIKKSPLGSVEGQSQGWDKGNSC